MPKPHLTVNPVKQKRLIEATSRNRLNHLSFILQLVTASGYADEALQVATTCVQLRQDEELWLPLLRSTVGSKRLFHALSTKNEKRLRWLCSQIHYPLTQCDRNDRSLVWYCVRHSMPTSVLEYLCSRGASVNHIDAQNESPLFYAILNNQCAMVQALIRCGADPHTSLCHAVRNGNLGMVKLLCDLGADALEERAIGCAVRYGQLFILLELLERGASVETIDPKGNSLLHYAVQFSHLHLCTYLLEFLDPNCLNEKRRTPLMFAATLEIWDQLHDAGAVINHRDTNGWTALHYATHHNRPHIVRRLLAHGANKDSLTHSGMTALDLAIVKDFQGIVELLSPS